jgi:hypothetical protein
MSHLDGNHWSASRFMLFEQCPRAYEDRYVHGIASEPSLAMLFGHCVHTALEVLLQGHGGSCLAADCGEDHSPQDTDHAEAARSRYEITFGAARAALAEDGIEAGGALYLQGLRMLEQVEALNLNADGRSQPERKITIPTEWAGLNWPVVGAVDLWSPPDSIHGPVVWDFKTTVGSWSQLRADKERWQPLLYTWAYVRAFKVLPTFRYLVLNRVSGALETFDRTWSRKRDLRQDLDELEFVAEEIAEAVRDGNFDCSRGHGTCLECGAPYGHGHVCATPKRSRLRLSGHQDQQLTQPGLLDTLTSG